MMNQDKIKAFAQNTLGCGCPEEVFQQIKCESGVTRDGVNIAYKIIIGNRLLIYVVTIDSSDSLEELLPRLFVIGKRERDSTGLNRFRLVLAVDDVDDIRQTGEHLFNTLERDDKIHLHVLSKTGIPKLFDV